jgi:hypothetical protein
VCFRYGTKDWGEIGEFQQLFFIDGTMVDGAVSVTLYISDTSRLAVELDDGIEPQVWLETLPFDAEHDERVDHVVFNTSTC